MSLPKIYSRPETEEQWSSWSFNHAANHNDWVFALLRQKNEIATQYQLDPIDPMRWALPRPQLWWSGLAFR